MASLRCVTSVISLIEQLVQVTWCLTPPACSLFADLQWEEEPVPDQEEQPQGPGGEGGAGHLQPAPQEGQGAGGKTPCCAFAPPHACKWHTCTTDEWVWSEGWWFKALFSDLFLRFNKRHCPLVRLYPGQTFLWEEIISSPFFFFWLSKNRNDYLFEHNHFLILIFFLLNVGGKFSERRWIRSEYFIWEAIIKISCILCATYYHYLLSAHSETGLRLARISRRSQCGTANPSRSRRRGIEGQRREQGHWEIHTLNCAKLGDGKEVHANKSRPHRRERRREVTGFRVSPPNVTIAGDTLPIISLPDSRTSAHVSARCCQTHARPRLITGCSYESRNRRRNKSARWSWDIWTRLSINFHGGCRAFRETFPPARGFVRISSLSHLHAL